MSRILTVTANTAIDCCIEIDQLSIGDNIVAKNCVEYAAGKGINVAKAVASLQYQVAALGFVGFQSRQKFDAIRSEYLETDFTEINGKTRSNFTLADNSNDQETHIRTTGFNVTADDCRTLEEKFEEYARPNDIVVLSGSLPPGAANDLYLTLIELCHYKGARVFLDTSGDTLINGLEAEPDVIKPNLKELEEIIGRILSSEKEIVTAAKSIINLDTQWVVVSRGKRGVIVVTNKLALVAEVECSSKKVISTIGCGDALVAGLAIATLGKESLSDAIKLGVSCATANLFSNEPGRIDPLLVDNFRQQIVIRSL